MKYRCPDCGREVDLPPKSHGDGCFSCGSDLRALTASIDGVTVDLALLKEKIEGRKWRDLADLESIPKALSMPEEARPYLRRMELEETSGAKEVAMQRLVVYALAEAEIL